MKKIIEVKNISKSFKLTNKQRKLNKTLDKHKTAVSDLSFTAYEGEIYGLLGANGAGKTTTLRMLATLIAPDSGTINIDGLDILKFPNDVRQKIGFLTSDLRLDDFFTPDYLFTFFSTLHGEDPALIEKRKETFFKKFEINEFREVKIKDLSTGMRQKVSLAISIAHDPDIVIFDEPTNGLDVMASKTVIDFLLDLKKEGKTIIISTHIFSLIEKLCDRVGIMKDGKMVLEGNLKDVCKDSSLEDVFFELYLKDGARHA